MPNHWIIRVGDGKNFKNSKYPFWGMKRGKHGCIKGIINKNFKKGDILWFITSVKSENGGKVVALAEYTEMFDQMDEQLFQYKTYSNEEQGWEGDEEWHLQLHYTNYYDAKNCDIKLSLSVPNIIMNYEKFKDKLEKKYEKFICLKTHYKLFKKYGTVKEFN